LFQQDLCLLGWFDCCRCDTLCNTWGIHCEKTGLAWTSPTACFTKTQLLEVRRDRGILHRDDTPQSKSTDTSSSAPPHHSSMTEFQNFMRGQMPCNPCSSSRCARWKKGERNCEAHSGSRRRTLGVGVVPQSV
jgi:hypothetical protein